MGIKELLNRLFGVTDGNGRRTETDPQTANCGNNTSPAIEPRDSEAGGGPHEVQTWP